MNFFVTLVLEMKIALIQHDILWEAPESNLGKIEKLLPETADLVVLPEMFATGFVTGASEVAGFGPEILAWMNRISALKGYAVAGSVAIRENGRFLNRFHFVKPDGSVSSYDKRHLFAYGGEARDYSCGDERVIVEWKGVRFLMLVCYDIRFPVWSRFKGDYDAILCVASWADDRRDAWDALLRARAIENQAFVAGVNRIGSDVSGTYSGGTAIYGPRGETVVSARENREEVIIAELDLQSQKDFRNDFNVFSDADDFRIL